MKTVTLEVRSPEEGMSEFVETWRSGKAQRSARRVQRDVKAVHSDVTALLSAGLLNRTETGNIEFPYEAIKVEFLLHAA
ncbi:MAG: hypothetical protein Q7U76_02020 [Nitrospirota bacterium]|jgi:predicted transcriptional regulator|nr:hypothetical protein [Nitrospirota bacterium]